jgi:hypothetical protein
LARLGRVSVPQLTEADQAEEDPAGSGVELHFAGDIAPP